MELKTLNFFILTSFALPAEATAKAGSNVLTSFYFKKKAPDYSRASFIKSATTYSPTFAVPSALAGLTSLFGMGRGGTPSL